MLGYQRGSHPDFPTSTRARCRHTSSGAVTPRGDYAQHQEDRHSSKKSFNHFYWDGEQYGTCLWTFLVLLTWERADISSLEEVYQSWMGRVAIQKPTVILILSLRDGACPGHLKDDCSDPLHNVNMAWWLIKIFISSIHMINMHPNSCQPNAETITWVTCSSILNSSLWNLAP